MHHPCPTHTDGHRHRLSGADRGAERNCRARADASGPHRRADRDVRAPFPPTAGFPTRTTTGTPPGWTPKSTVDGLRVTSPGQVVEDVRVKGDLTVAAKNVTLRRVEVLGRISNEQGGTCQSGLRIEDSTVRRGTAPTSGDWPAVLVGSYSADNVLIDGMPEGFRVGGKSLGCGAVTITNSYANVVAPDQCGDWHGDGLQGYDAPALTLRDTVLVLNERAGCYGTVAFFYPSNQGNTSVDIDGLVVEGGGFPFTLGMPGPVQNLHVVDKSWGYGPIKVDCSRSGTWDASISTLGADGQPTPVRDLPCTTQNGD